MITYRKDGETSFALAVSSPFFFKRDNVTTNAMILTSAVS